jgi:hypothetical protein
MGWRRFSAALLSTALVAGCAANDRAMYAVGGESYLEGRCAEARDHLAKFIRTECLGSEPDDRCQEAVWMQVQCDLRESRPAQALLDANVADSLGAPAPELVPPIKALRQRALVALQAAWVSTDRSAKLDTYLRDETSDDYVLRTLSLSIDLRAPVNEDAPTTKRDQRLLETEIPPGDHALTFTAKFSGTFRGARYEMVVRSAEAFVARPHETVRVVVRTRERGDRPLGLPPDRLAVDFEIVRSKLP